MEPPSNLTVPVVSGIARDGETLTTTLGTWDGTWPLDYEFQWQRCDAAGLNCIDIPGATAAEYVLVDADAGRRVITGRAIIRAETNAQCLSPFASRA